METPKISVVIPSFNKAEFIDKTLKSIFDQNCNNLEVIVKDGGSTDGTVEIIKKYAMNHSIILESKKDKGQLDAINKGLSIATGDILTFINADDYYFPDAFVKISEAFIKNPDALWFAGRGVVVDKNEKEIAKPATLYKNFLLSLNSRFNLLITNYLMQPSVFFTKEVFEECGPFIGTSGYVLEYDFWLKLANKSMPVVINDVLSSFRISENNISSVKYNKLLADDQKILSKYTKNPLIIFMHKINNMGRVFTINTINK
jgi:glycosyltransferase involved in cell wall biosynthesis